MAEQKDNSGAIFRNDDKRDENDRDYSGSATIDGVEYWISGWVNTSKKTDQKYLGLRFKPKEARRAPEPAPKPRHEPDLDDEIPF